MFRIKAVFYAILFALNIGKFKNLNIFNYGKEQYGNQELLKYRKLIDRSKKLEKCRLDVIFLLKCRTYDIVPKFIRFKL